MKFRQIAEHIEMIKEVKNNIQEAKYDKEVEEHCLTFFNSMGLPIKQKSHCNVNEGINDKQTI